MDREAAALSLYRCDGGAALADTSGLTLTNLQNLPQGTRGFSYVSTVTGNGICTRSTEITSTGNGPPRVVTHSSGNCRPEMNPSGGAGWSAPTTPKQPDML